MGGSAAGSSRQITLSKCKDARQEFILDYVKLCTLVDIPLEKTEKIRPFLRKYWPRLVLLAQAGAFVPN